MRSLLFLGAALLFAAGCSPAAPAPEEVVIGADLELSGSGANVGKVYEQALRLRVEQINHDGILRNRHLSLVIRDNRSDPATSAANIKALSGDPTIRALVTGACGQCIVDSAKVVNDIGIPTIALARPIGVSQPVGERRFVFKLGPNVDDDATVLTSELAAAALQRVAVVGPDDQYGTDAIGALSRKFERSGVTAGITERVPLAGGDLAATASRIAKLRPVVQAAVILAYAPSAAQMAQALRTEGFTGRFMFGSAAADGLFLSNDTASAMDGAGLVFTPTLVSDDIIATSPAKANRVAWFRDYLSAYGTYSAYASFAADAVNLVTDAIAQTGRTDRESLRTTIETTRMDGLSGPIRLTPANHSGLMPQAVTLLVATNGRWRLAS